MSNLPQIFNYETAQIRVIVKDGEPWFAAKDVCEVLDITWSGSKTLDRISENHKGVVNFTTPGGTQEMLGVDESGLYKLIMRSNKPEAETFQDWITDEVIPIIRKTGSYSMMPRTFAEALRAYADQVEQNELMRPKAEMHDLFISASNNQPMNDVAKALGTGRNKLFALLREKSIFRSNNTPYQRYIESGYFVVKEKPITMGEQTINKPQTFATAKGVDWLGRLLSQGAVAK